VTPLPEVGVAFVPDEPGVESLVTQIRKTGRAYPLVEIARMFLVKPERYTVHFTVRKDAQGKPKQPLFLCAVDNTLWLSEDQAARHILANSFDLFYQTERTPIDPPKGTYTFVAQCGISGIILGPPNYHDYQKQLHALHAERFARMPFESFKTKVKIVRDEEVVKKWLDEQSFKTSYICLNTPEALTLHSRAEVEAHFREHHLPNLVQAVESFTAKGSETKRFPANPLQRLVRRHTDDQRKFPLQVMTALSQQFGARGLQFFKVNKTITHVAVARPHYLDTENTPVSTGVGRIVEFINSHPDCNRKLLVESLAPSPATKPAVPTPPATEGTTPAEAAGPPPAPEPTPEQTAIIGDLHWLIHQGHVIEFATGKLETAKKPAVKPPQKPRDTAPKAPKPRPVAEAATPATDTPAQPSPTFAPPSEPAPAQEISANPPSEPPSASADEPAPGDSEPSTPPEPPATPAPQAAVAESEPEPEIRKPEDPRLEGSQSG